MASLTIRNLTTTPLELKKVERFEGDPVPGPSGVEKITSRISSLFNGTSTPPGRSGVSPRRDAGPTSTEDDLEGLIVQPFQSLATDKWAADPAREVLRLTFEQPGTANRWAVECPGSHPRSLVMSRVGGEGGPHEFTAVYTGEAGHLAVYSSAGLSSWMRELRDELPLSVLSIPGTHNSPTCYTALPSVRCQAATVREQLDNGVRFLDVRVSASQGSDDLALVHSAFPIALTGNRYLADMLADVYAFLDANPSEALIVSLKREGTGKGSDGDLSRHLKNRYCGHKEDQASARRWYAEPRIPTLGEVRGRIVLVRRFWIDDSLKAEHGGRGWGIDGSAWPDNCADGTVGSGLIRVQDFYEIDQSTNIEKKIELSRAHLERACERTFIYGGMQGAQPDHPNPQPAHLPFFVNFLTASNFFNATCWPERIAARVNPAVIEYLCTRHGEHGKGPNQLAIGDAATGIVVTDWVGKDGDWDLIRCIVGWNARLQLKQ